MGAVAATVASSLCLSSLAQVEQHDSLNHEDRDLALAEFVQRVARIPQLNLHASWTVRTRFAEPARRADGPAERVGVLEFVGRAGEFWASFTDDSADGAGGHAPVEIAWFGESKLAFVHQGRGETGTVSISSTPVLSGPFEDIPLLAQFVPGVAGLPLPRIADVLALTPSDAISRIDGEQYVWTLPNVWGAPGLVPTTLTFSDSSTPRLTRLVCRVPVPTEPSTSFPEPCGGEASVLVWKDVHGSSVAQSAERANFAWFPGRVSPDAQRTGYELIEANRASSRPSPFLQPAQWLVDGAGVSDLRIGAFGTIGDARLVIAGTRLRSRRSLAVEDVPSGQHATAHRERRCAVAWTRRVGRAGGADRSICCNCRIGCDWWVDRCHRVAKTAPWHWFSRRCVCIGDEFCCAAAMDLSRILRSLRPYQCRIDCAASKRSPLPIVDLC